MRPEIKKYYSASPVQEERGNEKPRDELILKYTPLIRYIADRLAMRLPPSISRDELISAGVVGLVDALGKFDADMGIQFRTYAEHRIKGAMLDELRKMDWVPRSVRKATQRIEEAILSLESRLGREPEDFEIAKELGLEIDAYFEMIRKGAGIGLLCLDEILSEKSTTKYSLYASDTTTPLDTLKTEELKKCIAQAISRLSEKEQLVISLYYYEELTLKEIAGVLNLTESRVCQIHAKAIVRLRAKLRAYFEA